MAPAKRQNQYFEPGVQGRKTGITLPINAKDEHGIENLDGIFSSPEKSPAKPSRVPRNGNTTLTSSDMDLAHSSVPEPTEVLSTRRLLKSSKTVFPPPLGRSPFKTNIGSSPRRQSSVAPMSQSRRTSHTPERAVSHPVVSRRLDFLAEDATTNGAQSPLRQAARRGGGRAARKDIYQLPVSPERLLKRTYEQSILEEADEEIIQAEVTVVEEVNVGYQDNDLPMEDSLQLVEDDGAPAIEEEELEIQQLSSPSNLRKSHTNRAPTAEADTQLEAEEAEESAVKPKPRRGGRVRTSLTNGDTATAQANAANKKPPAKKGRGRKAKGNLLVAAPVQQVDESSLSEEPSTIEEPTVLEESATEAPVEESLVEVAPRKRGRPAKKVDESVLAQEELLVPDDTIIPTIDESVVEPAKKRRGRPPKSATAVHQDDSSRPAKRAKTAAKAPVERDANARMGPPTLKKPGRPAAVSTSKRSVRAQSVVSSAFGTSRSILRLREGTPLEEEGSHRTRSGRIAMPPVNFWLGEKVEYGRDGAKVGMMYAEEVIVPRAERAGHGRRPRGRASKRSRTMDDMDVIAEEEEEEELEDWEQRCETIRVFVNRWDPLIGATGSEEEEQDVAFGANSLNIEEVGGGAKFAFTKIHSSTFFGTGMIEIPPGGYKLKKNSRKMTMAFFVHTGKVDVTVADSEFTISKGGIWQVPRGNTYSIHNPGDKTSRIFFAQGCQVLLDVDE